MGIQWSSVHLPLLLTSNAARYEPHALRSDDRSTGLSGVSPGTTMFPATTFGATLKHMSAQTSPGSLAIPNDTAAIAAFDENERAVLPRKGPWPVGRDRQRSRLGK